MRLQIGRLRGDLALLNVKRWNRDGERVDIAGSTPLDRAESLIVQERILGLVDNLDEEIVPVTFDANPAVDGYYRVLGARVEPYRFPLGRFPWSMSLQRVSGFAAPLMETVIVGALRTNTVGITTANAVSSVGVPDAVSEFYDDTLGGATLFTRTAADGVVQLARTISPYSRRQRFSILPADYYKAAATFEVGSTLRTVVGAQIGSELSNWRISNGLIRLSFAPTGFSVQCFDGTQWDTAKVFAITYSAGTAIVSPSPAGIRVLRNSPECVSVRLPSHGPVFAVSGEFPTYVDLTLRRGDRLVHAFASVAGVATEWGVRVVTAEAATALTGGIRATSNDAAGNRFVLTSPQTVTNDLVNGRIQQTVGASTFPCAFGFEVGGTGAATNDQAQNLIYQYMAASSERVMVTAR